MVRKIIVLLLLLAVTAAFFGSCELFYPEQTEDSDGSSEHISLSDAPVADSSYSTEISLVELPDDPSEPMSVPDPVSEPEFDPTTCENPTCLYSRIETPRHSDDGKFPIRSLTQTQTGEVLSYGYDPEDAEMNEALASIRALLDAYEYNDKISFFAYSLDGTRVISYNCEQAYSSACTVKTGFVLYCCLAIDQGLASKDEVMYYQSDKYFHTGSGDIKYSPDGTPYTLETLIRKALSISDNVAYEMLTAYFGHDGYNRMVEELGVPRLKLGSSLWSRQMNARDLAIIWRELYFYFESGSPMSKVYYNSCTNTPKSLAYAISSLPDIKYSHKSGDMFPPNAVTNDGVLIWNEYPYVLTVLNATEHAVNRATMDAIVQQIHYHLMKY